MKQLVKQTCWRRCATVVLFLIALPSFLYGASPNGKGNR